MDVTLWHFGADSHNYRELIDDKYCVTWHVGQNVLGRIYNKRMKIKRSEIQGRPNKPYADAIKDITTAIQEEEGRNEENFKEGGQ